MASSHALIVDPDQQKVLEQLAARELRSPKVLLREVLDDYLCTQKARALLQNAATTDADPWDFYDGPTYTEAELLAESQESWKDFQQTGLHLTHEEVSAWIEQLRTDPKTKLPECHV